MIRSDGDIYARIVRRITLAMLIIGSAGTVAATAQKGWRFGLGFLLGAAASFFSFWRWRKIVESIGAGPPQGRAITRMILRFGVLVGLAYAIVKYLEVNPVAVFLGLFVAAASVIVAILFELIYART